MPRGQCFWSVNLNLRSFFIHKSQILVLDCCISSQTKKFTRTSDSSGGPCSVVGMATGYGMDGPGIESRWGRDFPHLSRPALGPTQPPVQWVPGLSRGVKSGRGVMLSPHPLLVPWLWKGELRYSSTPPMGRTVCTEPQCLYTDALYLTFQTVLQFILTFPN